MNIENKLNIKNLIIIVSVFFLFSMLGFLGGFYGYKFMSQEYFWVDNYSISNAAIMGKICSDVFGIISFLIISFLLIDDQLRDNSLYSASWVRGSKTYIFTGLILGILIAVFTLMNLLYVFPNGKYVLSKIKESIEFFNKILLIPHLLLRSTFVPLVEELLFRGLIFGLLSKKMGVWGGSIVTTILFIALHLSKTSIESQQLIGVTILAIAAILLRIKSKSIGPSVTLHCFYNLTIDYFYIFCL